MKTPFYIKSLPTELSNHLGNVLVTVSAKPILVDSTQNNIVDYKMADVMSVADYYPFGMMMPSRHWSSEEYRFGFNTQEKVDEIAGKENHNTAEFWEYSTRTGRVESVLKVKFLIMHAMKKITKNTFLYSLFIFILKSNIAGQDFQYYDSIGNEHSLISKHYKFFKGKKYLNLISPFWKLDTLGYLGYRRRRGFGLPNAINNHYKNIKFKDAIYYLGKPNKIEIIDFDCNLYIKLSYITYSYLEYLNLERLVIIFYPNGKLKSIRHFHL